MQGGRPKAREVLFRVLYEVEISEEDVVESLEYSLGRYHLSEDARDHVMEMARAYDGPRDEIDDRISGALVDWSFSRLSVVVRSVLRLAVTELVHAVEIPVEVVLDQAIRLAQRYGESGSDAFVNGVLDRIAGEVRPAENGKRGRRSEPGKR
jgi:N utilization substance protein B